MIKIKPLQIKEIPIVQNLAKIIWDEYYRQILSQAQIDYMLKLFYSTANIQQEINEKITWDILYLNENPVGYISCKIENKKVHLSKIYLKAETRGKGLGKMMLNHAYEITQKNQCNSLYLNVNKNNLNSIKFYESQGFVKIDEGVFDIGNGYVMDDYIMEKIVSYTTS